MIDGFPDSSSQKNVNLVMMDGFQKQKMAPTIPKKDVQQKISISKSSSSQCVSKLMDDGLQIWDITFVAGIDGFQKQEMVPTTHRTKIRENDHTSVQCLDLYLSKTLIDFKGPQQRCLCLHQFTTFIFCLTKKKKSHCSRCPVRLDEAAGLLSSMAPFASGVGSVGCCTWPISTFSASAFSSP